NLALDAVVDGNDVKFGPVEPIVSFSPDPPGLIPYRALTRSDRRNEVHADEPRPIARFLPKESEIKMAGRLVRDHRIRHASGADQACQRAGIEAAQADDAARLEPFVQVPGGAIARRLRYRGVKHNTSGAEGCRHVEGFDVLLV